MLPKSWWYDFADNSPFHLQASSMNTYSNCPALLPTVCCVIVAWHRSPALGPLVTKPLALRVIAWYGIFVTNRNTKLKPRELRIFFAFRGTRTLQSDFRFFVIRYHLMSVKHAQDVPSTGSCLASFNRITRLKYLKVIPQNFFNLWGLLLR